MTGPVAEGRTVSSAFTRRAPLRRPILRKRLFTTVPAALIVSAAGIAALLRGGVTRRAPAGLPDAGPLTAWALPACRFAADVAAAATVGFLVAAVILLPRSAAGPARGIAARCAASWSVAAAAELVFTHSDIVGAPLPRALSTWTAFPQEQALAAQAVLALVACALAVRSPKPAVVPAGGALLLPLATGHSGTASHTLAMPALVVHVTAATVWTGGLLAVAWIARRVPDHLAPAAERFSRLALACFAATAVSGVANALLRLHTPADLVTSAYGQLTAAKSIGLVLLGLCGARHRRAVLPRLRTADGGAAFGRLARSELIIMATTFAVAVALSRTAPPDIARY
ncbi:copper resistance D family protein [Catenulispora subtropica]|uniref:CopD family protein n=1 Tax=Catenulispora subtropica TaxID=450798 RepID=A0ABP5ENK8_9ACTN